MVDHLIPAQIRSARGALDWSMLDLATAAGVSVSSVKRAEDGLPRPLSAGIHARVRCALEQAGIVFLGDDGTGLGLRWRPEGTRASLDRAEHPPSGFTRR